MEFGLIKVTTDWPEVPMKCNKRYFNVTVQNTSSTVIVSNLKLHIDLDEDFSWWDENGVYPRRYLKVTSLPPGGVLSSKFKASFIPTVKAKEETDKATLTFSAIYSLSYEGELSQKSVAEFTLS